MTAKRRNEAALIMPVNRNIVSGNRVNRDSSIPLTSLTIVPVQGYSGRKGKAPQKIGMWGTVSQNYKTPGMTTHDGRWSQTVQNRSV